MAAAKEKFSLKDHLFNKQKVEILSNEILQVYDVFDAKNFNKEVLQAFPTLELKQRITHIVVCLQKYLPQNYVTAIDIIIKALPTPLDPTLKDDDFGDFIHAPYSEFVATYGCNKQYYKVSLNALKEITKRFSAEYSIRNFINYDSAVTMATLLQWTKDKNYHVRRLCSEGTRPTLPWAAKVNINYTETIAILNALHTDTTRFVTRSVANHLNDIAKKDPALVISTLQHWQQLQLQNVDELQFITKHATRTLVKDGNAAALALLGFTDGKGVQVNIKTISPIVKFGEQLQFSIDVNSTISKSVVIDYIVHFKTQKGFSKKVFKLKNTDIVKGKVLTLSKNHTLDNYSTRALYSGMHQLNIQVNGAIKASAHFEVVEK